jgi:hypothetical protein
MASVQQYYPNSFFADQQAALQWLLSRQQAQNSDWEAAVLETGFPGTTEPGAPYVPSLPALIECAIVDLVYAKALSSTYFDLETVENLIMAPPPGQALDNQGGPDGFPVNYSPTPTGLGNMFMPVYPLSAGQISAAYAANVAKYDPYGHGVNMCTPSGLQYLHPLAGMDVYGYLLNLQPGQTYRIDLFVLDSGGTFHYQSSALWQGPFETGGQCQGQQPAPSCFQSYLTPDGYWGAQITMAGLVVAAAYPASVTQPSSGWTGAALPAGWVCHSNTGVGQKLEGYFARLYSYDGSETLEEDNIPIIVQDLQHARCGSSLVPAAGQVTLHILYSDPVLEEPVLVYTSLAGESAFADLPLSYIVPSSDPAYVPDPSASSAPAPQNRSRIYDCALGIMVFAASGNFHAAAEIIAELDAILANPVTSPGQVLENGAGSSARWTKSNGGDSVSDVADPSYPPSGGNVVDFHALAGGDSFTYSGSGFPDATDTAVQWSYKAAAGAAFIFTITVTSAAGKVTTIKASAMARTSRGRFPPTLPPGTYSGTEILIPVDLGNGSWQDHTLMVGQLVAQVAGDELTAITGFAVEMGAAGDLYFNALAVSSPQPAGSLFESYDTFHGQPDQKIIRAGTLGWLCYAYAFYMVQSGDYTPAVSLQAMIAFLLMLQSSNADLTNDLYRQGFGSYPAPDYQLTPGALLSVRTRDQAILYFAFTRAAAVLVAASVQLLKTNSITLSQAASMQSAGRALGAVPATIAAKVIANLYIPASGGVPGHFAQGASASGLDTSENLEAQTWGALLAHAAGQDGIALQCLDFAQDTFYLANQTIAETEVANAWNEVYEQARAFNGYKPFADSAGGYSGSPASVSQEGTWGAILAILALYDAPGLSSALGEVLDTLLATLIVSQRTVWQAALASDVPGDVGATLAYSLASRAMPWQFFVWAGFGATAWEWLTANAPGLVLTAANVVTVLPNMKIPSGMSQNVTEEEGASSVGGMTIEFIDPSGLLKQLAAENALVGQTVEFQMGFPSQALGDFVTLHVAQIVSVGYSKEGKILIELRDVQRFVAGKQIFKLGGPFPWAPGEASQQPIGDACEFNALPVSDKNPRWIQGNPIRIALAVLQNELGVGQDPALFRSTYVLEQLADVYSSEQDYLPAPLPAGWQIYKCLSNGHGYQFDDSTLINPNQYIDVPQWLNLADSVFSGDHFEFKITRSAEGKGWIEDQIFKPLGIYLICGADGKLRLKTMRPQPWQPVIFQFNQKNILSIPEVVRQPVLNVVTVKTDVDVEGDSRSGLTLSARAYQNQTTLEQPTSIIVYRQEYAHQVESTGLRVNYGGMLRATLVADRIFRRHAFAPPAYRFEAFLAAAQVEIGDLVTLTHPKALDLQGGTLSLVNVPCEVIERKPNWAQGRIEFLLFDRRYLNVGNPYQVYPSAQGEIAWDEANPQLRQQYMFVSSAALGGENDDGTPGNTIF